MKTTVKERDSKAGIVEIAKQAQVSIATVSRALNLPDLVSETTRTRVLEAVKKLGYEAPVRRKRRLSKPKTRQIGMLVASGAGTMNSSIQEVMLRGIQRELRRHEAHFQIQYFDTEGPLNMASLADRLDACDGWLVSPPASEELTATLCRGRKCVLLGRTFPNLDVPAVLSDDAAGMHSLLSYLHELGHRRAVFIGSSSANFLIRRRLDAFRNFLLEKDLPCGKESMIISPSPILDPVGLEKFICDAVATCLAASPRPTVVVCDGDSVAARFVQIVRQSGFSVPETFSVTGYGDSFYAAFVEPPLTTVHVDREALGEMGAQLLFKLLDRGRVSGHFNVSAHLVERSSCRLLDA